MKAGESRNDKVEELSKEKSPRILVVDDSQDILNLLTDILTNYNYQVRHASGGSAALKSVAVEVPDLILLDIKMPDMDGFEVCYHLKSDEKSRMIPVIFISALDEVVDKIKGFEAGGVDYITKPFRQAEVLARVETHLSLRRQKVQSSPGRDRRQSHCRSWKYKQRTSTGNHRTRETGGSLTAG